MNICVIIPTYNESQVIADLVRRIKALRLEALVIDDGSDDNTGELARNNGAMVLRNEKKTGKGASLRKGFAFALTQPFDAIITMDGDGQHDPDDIRQFIMLAEKKSPCLIVGNRITNARGMPFIRWLTNRTMSAMISAVCRQRVQDSQCGFRFISSEILKKIKLQADKFEIESEIIIQTAKKGFRIYSVPIRTIYGQEKSNINPFIDTLRFLKFIFKELWTAKD